MKYGLFAAALALVAGYPATALADETAPLPAQAPAATAIIGTALNVIDLDKEMRFYIDGLGMKLLMQMGPDNHRETMLGFAHGLQQPGIILMSDSTASAPHAHAMGDAFSRLVIRIANLPAMADRLRGKGYTVTAVRDVAKGYRMAMATDPEGFRLELVESSNKAGS